MQAPARSAGWRELVTGATRLLREAGVPSPEVDAVALQRHLTGIAVLAMAPAPTAAQGHRFAELVARRAAREPLQHITGEMAFRHLLLHAGPGAFVVRPETELVAEEAIDAARRTDHPTVVDLCAGSGAIALAVATEVAGSRVWAVELSEAALALARRNVARHAPQVELVAGDVADALGRLAGSVDVVVANPPYIPPDAVPRDVEVREHDPDVALYGGGADGLAVPRVVIARAALLLRGGGTFVMEHAEVQAAAVREAVTATGAFRDVRTARDLAGRDRMVVASRAMATDPPGCPPHRGDDALRPSSAPDVAGSPS